MIIASDLEGTLTTGSSVAGLAKYLQASSDSSGYKRFVRSRLKSYLAAQIGLQDKQNFRNRWLRDFIQLFEGRSRKDFAEIAEWVVEHELWAKRREDVLAAIASQNPEKLVLSSGAYTPILQAFAKRIEADDVIGTGLEFSENRLTGKLAGRINVKNVKARRLQSYLGDDPLHTAYGDTEADVPMLKMAENAVAVYPDKNLRRTATALGWRVIG